MGEPFLSPLTLSLQVHEIAAKLGATASDIPGLWNLPGFPELTTNQLRVVFELNRHWRIEDIAKTLID